MKCSLLRIRRLQFVELTLIYVILLTRLLLRNVETHGRVSHIRVSLHIFNVYFDSNVHFLNLRNFPLFDTTNLNATARRL